MKILVIDRDTLAVQLLRTRLEGHGHQIIEEPVKNNALERLGAESYDAIFLDPAPLNNARPIVLGIRRATRAYPYIAVLSQDMETEDALKAGANDLVHKPLDGAALEETAENARRLTQLIRRIGDESYDFPSAGGVIAKSAFNQLFLAGIDRADRYGERSYILFIGIDNHKQVLEMDGQYAIDYAAAKLSQALVRLRRQSDIIAQTDRSEYALLLQRPQYETEPMEAANRFADSLARLSDIAFADTPVDIYVRLIDLPRGALLSEHITRFEKNQGAARKESGEA